MDIEAIARTCHEVNRGLCESQGDDTNGISLLVATGGTVRAFIPIAQLRAFIERHDRGSDG